MRASVNMFKLSDIFMQEAEAEAASGGDVVTDETNSDDQTDLGEGQDNTETSSDDDDIENTDDKADDETAKDSESDSDDDSDNDGVPEKYDFEVPEGLELDAELAEKFTDVAKDLGLSNEQANKVVGLYAEQIQGMQEAQQASWGKTVADWSDELKADPEFGGAKFNENAEIAKMAVNKFGGDDLKKALNETGLGNHPAIVKFMHKVGVSISEDSFESNEDGGGKGKSTAQGLYSKSQMNP